MSPLTLFTCRLAEGTRKAVDAWGLKLLCKDPRWKSDSLTVIEVPKVVCVQCTAVSSSLMPTVVSQMTSQLRSGQRTMAPIYHYIATRSNTVCESCNRSQGSGLQLVGFARNGYLPNELK